MCENQEMENRCQYFLARKRRHCKMTVKGGHNFCAEHLSHIGVISELDEKLHRIPCPNDPKHTCYAWKLQKHLKKCNARLRENPEYIIPGINKGSAPLISKQRKTLAEIENEDLLGLIKKIKSISQGAMPLVSEEIYNHSILTNDLRNSEYGPSVRKHRIQNASLIGHVEHSNLLQPDTCFIEFGAGRGQLSFWLGQVASRYEHNLLLLIDKESHRHKFDKQRGFNSDINVQRLRTDIADLSLVNLPIIQDYSNWVAISKHLCGSATDLALRCLTAACNAATTMGVVMAPCCHHKGDWDTYIGQEFLLTHDISQEEFIVMSGIASWATCGARISDGDYKQSERYATLNLSPEEREDIGKMCKHVLDYGRLKYLENLGFNCKLVHYVSSDISPENVCMIAVKM